MNHAVTYAVVVATVAIGSCAIREALAGPAEEAKAEQIQQAAQLPVAQPAPCVWLTERACVSQAEFERITGRKREQEK